MNSRPVSPTQYDEKWIKNAWGTRGNDYLFGTKDIVPRPRVARALELCNIGHGDYVLDIACGRGEVPVIAAQQGAHAIGLDFSPTVLGIAKKLRAIRQSRFPGEANMELVQSDACVLPFRDGSFDRVTMLDIIEHLNPEQLDFMVKEVRRVLKPNGYAVIHTLPNRWVYDIGYTFLRMIYRRLPTDPRSQIEKQVHINEQDLPTLSKTLEDCGFSYRIWLEQKIPAQARWQKSVNRYNDNRDIVYPKLAGFVGRLVELLSFGPFKLILCNDIYGLLWKDERPITAPRLPSAIIERLTCSLLR